MPSARARAESALSMVRAESLRADSVPRTLLSCPPCVLVACRALRVAHARGLKHVSRACGRGRVPGLRYGHASGETRVPRCAPPQLRAKTRALA
eukprot:9214478-Alexandrium_andersonii.AAC.1